ncbi:hypothetical protein OUZ56_003432 [Daphnia magna]|uniref:Uncharacterized protein n=1 Tax=Daphnia magna TaxID=35525 RepID=A0ABR0A8T9_9CRUS|nr:hypothetical protein OUZ56_003432 [Daphnia magna]
MRGKYVATEEAMFHPQGTLALGDLEWVVIYEVPTKRAEQVRHVTWLKSRQERSTGGRNFGSWNEL